MGNGVAGGVIHAAANGHGGFRLLLIANQLSAPGLTVKSLITVIGIQRIVSIISFVVSKNSGAVVDRDFFVACHHEHAGLHIHRVSQSLALTGSQGTHVIGKAAVVFIVTVRICKGRSGFVLYFR